jgi:RimJ/RimL family protein N-acetyltransferase
MTSYAPDWPLATERLLLRPFEEGDYDVLYEIRSDPEVTRYIPSGVRSPEQVRELLGEKIARAAIDAEGQWLSAAIALRDGGEVVGEMSLLWASEEHRQGELGYGLHPAHHGRGYATEAARPMLAFGFETLGLHRIVGRLDERNAASARVLEKLGMRREALLVENEWIRGEWTNELVYAVLAREWRGGTERART